MINPAMLPQSVGSQTLSGQMGMGDVAELSKALAMGYGTDQSALTGGAALRIQSLDKTMMATIQENQHFRLFNALVKSDATATVDEWTEQSGIGGFLGGSTNSETGAIAASQGQYARRVGLVKYLMTRREVSFVSTITNNIVEAEAVEAQNGALQLLTDAEYLCFEGDSSVVPTEFDGIYAQLRSLADNTHVIDAAGSPIKSIDFINRAAATISGYGNFGTPTHIFMSQSMQADFDTNLDPAFRVALTNVPNGGISIGAPVVGIRTSHGNIQTMSDVFIRDEPQQMPFELSFPAVATANVGFKPANVALVPVNAANTTSAGNVSLWQTLQAGAFYYWVAGINAAGQSPALAAGAATVVAGGSVQITITASASQAETGYVIYRGRLNGTGALSDVREMKRIPVSGGATTVFVDLNGDIPGSVKAVILNMTRGANSIAWRQLLPMTKFPLFPTVSATVPWAQLLFGYLRLAKRKHHVMFKNVVTSSQTWRPFN